MKTIRTIEELSDLPIGSVILSRCVTNIEGLLLRHVAIRIHCTSGENCWMRAGDYDHWSHQEMEWFLPAILLWNPEDGSHEY